MTDKKCIFLVDDDSSARIGLARLLRKAGHDVRDFASANDFLDEFEPDMSGCLVLDARMPGMSSDELIAKLNTRCSKIPIIVVTGNDAPETREIAKAMKAAGFFRKPVDGPALLDAINWVLQSKNMQNKY